MQKLVILNPGHIDRKFLNIQYWVNILLRSMVTYWHRFKWEIIKIIIIISIRTYIVDDRVYYVPCWGPWSSRRRVRCSGEWTKRPSDKSGEPSPILCLLPDKLPRTGEPFSESLRSLTGCNGSCCIDDPIRKDGDGVLSEPSRPPYSDSWMSILSGALHSSVIYIAVKYTPTASVSRCKSTGIIRKFHNPPWIVKKKRMSLLLIGRLLYGRALRN